MIRDADAGFPAVGTKLHHTIGVGPLTLNDHTEVLEAEPPRRLKLRAKGRPIGTASVELILEPRGGGTNVCIVEDPDQIYTPLKYNPLLQLRDAGAQRQDAGASGGAGAARSSRCRPCDRRKAVTRRWSSAFPD